MKPSRSKQITAIYQQARIQEQAFVAFRLPNTDSVKCIVGNISRTLTEGEEAFTFASFNPGQKPYYIKVAPTLSNEKKPATITPSKQKSTTKKQYYNLVKTIIQSIGSGDFKKVVAARVLAVDRPDTFDPIILFEKLCSKYATVFVSLTFIPSVGLWIGASPEVLVSETKTRLTTYSLAGTKVIDDRTLWSAKEIEEQQIVTDFIHKKLRRTIDDKITITGPSTHDAGRIKHLLSVFTIAHSGKSIWKKVVKALHPTPAVAGMPQLKSVRFVTQHESFERAFYAGYLGTVNHHGKTDLFVNLRCMQVTDTQLLFYAGCGITADSDPAKEWLESERKIDILKSLIQEMI